MQNTLLRFEKGFHVAFANARTQAAQMTIAPGDAEGRATVWRSWKANAIR